MKTTILALTLFLALTPLTARADGTAALAPKAEIDQLAASQAGRQPGLLAAALPWTRPSGQGVAIGIDNALWAGKYAQSARVRVPLGTHWALVFRPVLVHGIGLEPYRIDGLFRAEIAGGSAVYFNVLRVYGGGGPHVGTQLTGVDERELIVGLGGHVGLEAFFAPRSSFYFEIGASGDTADTFTDGATVAGGMLLYL